MRRKRHDRRAAASSRTQPQAGPPALPRAGPAGGARDEGGNRTMSTSGRPELDEHPVPAPGINANSLEQVREILFGPQHREFTRRLARTDVHLAAQVEELRNEARRRLDVLEAYARQGLEGLTAA